MGRRRCCCCQCECANCEGGVAPCCFKVVISGITEGTCGDCDSLNGTYYLTQDPDDDCHWIGTGPYGCCPACDVDSIDLWVLNSYGTYSIRVALGDHVWEKGYGSSRPDCCKLTNEALTHSTSVGDCDSSSATCTVSKTDASNCEPSGCTGCSGDLPRFFEVTISGSITSPDPPNCAACANVDGTYLLRHCGGCVWRYCFDDPVCGRLEWLEIYITKPLNTWVYFRVEDDGLLKNVRAKDTGGFADCDAIDIAWNQWSRGGASACLHGSILDPLLGTHIAVKAIP